MKFLVSFLFGLVAEIATGLVIGAGMAITRGSAMPSSSAELPSWVAVVAMVAGSLFTFLFGLWRASRHNDRPVAHGLLVAAGAVMLHLVSSLGAGRPFTAAHIVGDLLKLAAGVAAGETVRRRSKLSASVA
jgi:uncharacterized membrane protein